MTVEQFLNNIKLKQSDFNRLVNRTLPIDIGVLAKAHFQENFEKGGFVDNGLKKWKPAKRLSLGRKEARFNSKTLLSGDDHLFNSIAYVPGFAQVKIVNPVEYAKVHNEGLKAGRGKGFIMPKRTFIGKSHELDVKVEDKIDSEVSKIIHK